MGNCSADEDKDGFANVVTGSLFGGRRHRRKSPANPKRKSRRKSRESRRKSRREVTQNVAPPQT